MTVRGSEYILSCCPVSNSCGVEEGRCGAKRGEGSVAGGRNRHLSTCWRACEETTARSDCRHSVKSRAMSSARMT